MRRGPAPRFDMPSDHKNRTAYDHPALDRAARAVHADRRECRNSINEPAHEPPLAVSSFLRTPVLPGSPSPCHTREGRRRDRSLVDGYELPGACSPTGHDETPEEFAS